MATMTWQDLMRLQQQNPGASREQLAALWQQQQASVAGGGGPAPTPAPTPVPAPDPSSTNVPKDPTTGQPLNVSAGSGKPVDPTQWTQFTQDLGTASDTNHSQINTLMQRLQGAGYQVQPGPIDSQGRQDSLVINGVLTRVFDSSGNWKPIQDVNGSAWGGAGGGGGGGGGGGIGTGSLGYGLGTGANYGPWTAPWTGQWQAPTAEQALQSPGVQFALNNSLRVMENNAAAQGVLGNARAQEAISQNLGQQLLGNYNQIYGQALTSYQQNQADFFANQDRPFTKNLQVAQNIGLPAATA